MTSSPQPERTQALVLTPSSSRTATGIAVMVALAVLLLRAALAQAPLSQAAMIAVAMAALALSLALWRGRNQSLHWTAQGLVDGQGRVIAARHAIARVDRSPLSMKPSNGFNLAMKGPQPRAWQPGLYWRLGRRIGVGGLTPPGVAKAMADRIALDTAPPPDAP